MAGGEEEKQESRCGGFLVGFQSLALSGRMTHSLSLSRVKFCYGLDQPENLKLL